MGNTINFDEILIVNSDWNWILLLLLLLLLSLCSCLRLHIWNFLWYSSHSFSLACQNKMYLFVYNEKRNIRFSWTIFASSNCIVHMRFFFIDWYRTSAKSNLLSTVYVSQTVFIHFICRSLIIFRCIIVRRFL